VEQRLIGGGGRGGRGGVPTSTGPAPVQPVRTRLSGLLNAFIGSGARTGTFAAPTATMHAAFAEAKIDLAKIGKEMQLHADNRARSRRQR
jgi:hypothetical protein